MVHFDPGRAKNIDRHNKRRLIRALEIVMATGKPVPRLKQATRSAVAQGGPEWSRGTAGLHYNKYDALWVGIKTDRKLLYKKIDARLKQRLKAGMVAEVSRLHKGGLSWKKLESFGLEYKFLSLYLEKKLTYDEMLTQLSFAIKHYSKRQMTWWKKNKVINWIKSPKLAEKAVARFLK